nr:hypothetical protein CFP56_18513 [Quercus suber]
MSPATPPICLASETRFDFVAWQLVDVGPSIRAYRIRMRCCVASSTRSSGSLSSIIQYSVAAYTYLNPLVPAQWYSLEDGMDKKVEGELKLAIWIDAVGVIGTDVLANSCSKERSQVAFNRVCAVWFLAKFITVPQESITTSPPPLIIGRGRFSGLHRCGF